ncbi:BAG family molecular chaperone regulator 4 [Discoglossus pictus]
MSAAQKPGMGGSRYYVPGGRDVQNKDTAWRPGYNPQEAGGDWIGERAMGGAQNSSYPVYDPNCWPSSVNPQAPYPSNFHGGCQRIEPCMNDSYGQPYPQASMHPPYPPNQYYHPPPQPHYPVDQPSSGTPHPPNWVYSPHGTQNVSRQPPYPAQDAIPSYQYQDTNSDHSQQAVPQHCPPPQDWHVYDPSNSYQWQPLPPPHYNPTNYPYIAGGQTPWPGGDNCPSAYDVKDQSHDFNYSQQRPYQSYHPNAPQPEPASKPNLSTTHYSSGPQMYNRKDPENSCTGTRAKVRNPSLDETNPSIQKISQILDKVDDMEREVSEFVGLKTDMSYRSLEERLTKELLQLDSVDTGGLDNVRKVRKDAVRKLQFILEKLEQKGM